MHPHLKSLLVKAGCDPNSSDEDAQKFYDGMSADKRADIDGKLSKMMEGEPDGDEVGASARPVPPLPGDETPASLSAMTKMAETIAAAVVASLKPQQQAAGLSRGNAARNPQQDDDEAFIALEEKRVQSIHRIAALHKGIAGLEGVVQRCIGENMTLAKSREAVLRHVAEAAKPLQAVSVGEDRRIASLREAMPQALILRAGMGERDTEKENRIFTKLGVKPHEEAYKLRDMTMLDMFRSYLVAHGVNAHEVYGLSRAALASCLGPKGMSRQFPRFAALAESTSDFSNITLDAINKALRFNYLDAKRTWPIWCEKKFAVDFKTINSIALSEAPSMVSTDEGGELRYVALTDSKETAKLKTYKAGIKLTRNAIINDDLDAFNSLPRLQANSAARLEDDVAYALITANATMADTGALFNATAVTTAGGHANYTASDAAPSVTTLQLGKTKMKKQKGLANVARLELEPKYLLVPTSIEEQTKELIGSQKLIASQSSSGSAPLTVGDNNPFFNRYQVVGSTRLDDASTTAWYLVADYRDGQVGTFQLYFLTDEPEPVLRTETDFDSEDVKYLVRHTVVGLVPEFRGSYKSNGA